MKTLNLNRNISTLTATAAITLGPDVDQLICDATSAGFTVILCDFEDGADHQVEIIISTADSSGNTVSVSGNAGAFTASLSSSGTTSAIFQTQYDGTWFIAGDVSSVSVGAANSRAISAGLAASNATSAATSGVSQANSVATSQNLSQSTTISTVGSVAGSATLSGVSATASVATSQNVSQSATVSVAQSTAAS
jgi:hypothetical protein